MLYRNCNHCNKEFGYYKSRIKLGKAKFCSQRCWMDSGERKEMMSSIHSGKKCPFAKPPHFSGKEHWNWRGGITKIQVKIRNSSAYKFWRKAVFERDKYTCQICGIIGGSLHADHIKPFSLFPELRLDVKNGRTLCIPCHEKTDTYKSKARNYVRNFATTG